MLTYADHIATVWAAMQRRDIVAAGRIPSSDTARLFHEAVHRALAYARVTNLDRDNTERGELAWFSRFIAPFAGYCSDGPPLAISLDMGIDLRLQDSFESIREYAGDIVAEHGSVYIDIPEGGYMLPGRVFQVRALFIRRFREGIRFCAILTRPGSTHGWRFAWREGRHQRSQLHGMWDDVWAMSSHEICDRYRPINSQKIDYSEFTAVEKMAWAALAQWRITSEMEPENEVRVLIPSSADACSLKVSETPLAQEEAFTLFKKVPLRLVRIDASQIERIERQHSTSMKPRAEHDVRAFYRWQPYGPNRSLRRRQLIKGFARGSGPRKTPLNSVTPSFG